MDIKFKDNSQLRLAPFTQLEYIESTGTQYIDTCISFSNGYRIVTELTEISSLSQTHRDFSGSYESGKHNIIRIYNGMWNPCVGGNANSSYGTVSLSTKYSIDISNANNKYNVMVNGVTLATDVPVSGSYSSLSCWLFALHRVDNTDYQYFAGRMGNIKLYNEFNVIVRDFIPVKDSNNIVCLYDTISRTFFYNQGTGDFIAGPVVKCCLPENILLKTTTLYHENTTNIDGLQLLNSILEYQKTHQDEVKECYYPTTQLWQDIIIEYPDILYWYNIDHKFCIYICESDDPEQCAEDFLDVVDDIKQELDDYPDLIPIIAENPGVASVIAEYPSLSPIIVDDPSIAPIIADNPEVVHSLVDTGYVTSIKGNGAQYIDTGLAGNSAMEIQLRLKYGTGAQDLILGNSWTGIAYIVHRYGNSIVAYWGGRADFAISDITKFVNVVYKSNYASVDNVSKEMAGNPSLTTGTLKLLGFGNNYNNQYSQLNYYKRYDDNVLIQWLVPIQNNGNPCMIDLLTGTKYLNQGTGSFTYSLEPKNA